MLTQFRNNQKFGLDKGSLVVSNQWGPPASFDYTIKSDLKYDEREEDCLEVGKSIDMLHQFADQDGFNFLFRAVHYCVSQNLFRALIEIVESEKKLAFEKGLRSSINLDRQFGILKESLVHRAASLGHFEIVLILVNRFSCSVFLVDRYQRRPSKVALLAGHKKIHKFLINVERSDNRNDSPI